MSAPRRFLSVCSGIEAASVAFQPLGWEAVAVAEIEPFPCAVLAHRYGASRPWHMPLPHTPAERLAIVHLSTPWVSWALMDALNKAAAPFEAAIKAVRTLPDPATATLPNLGDLTRWREWPVELLEEADGLCGGTPCQGFSVAGLRGSLDDERGNLTLTFCHLYDRLDEIRHAAGRPPAVCLWENVPGVFSTHDNAFGCLLAGLAGEDVPLEPPGGKWTDAGAVRGPRRAVAWRVLDAQYCGLAQRRKRVFVVASADPAFDPVAVLFEFGGLRRDSAPSRGPGEGTAHDVAPCLTSGGRGVECTGETRGQYPVVAVKVLSAQCSVAFGGNNTSGPIDAAAALNANRGCHNPGDFEAGTLLVENATAHTLRGEGFDASEDGTGRGTPLVPIAFPAQMSGTQCATEENLCPVLQSHNPTAVACREVAPAITGNYGKQVDNSDTALGPMVVTENHSFAFDLRGREGGAMPEGPHPTANLRASSGGSSRSYVAQEPIAFDTTQITSAANRSQPQAGDACHPLAAGAHPPAIALPESAKAFNAYQRTVSDVCTPIMAGDAKKVEIGVLTAWKVRRLTPEECEILQGFPVGYTLIPGTSSRRRKGADLSDTIDYLMSLGASAEQAATLAHSPDGPRYKALGNSWAVPVARWIGVRIEAMLSTARAE